MMLFFRSALVTLDNVYLGMCLLSLNPNSVGWTLLPIVLLTQLILLRPLVKRELLLSDSFI